MADPITRVDDRVPERSEGVLRYVLAKRAALHPDRPYLRLPDGSSIAYGQLPDFGSARRGGQSSCSRG